MNTHKKIISLLTALVPALGLVLTVLWDPLYTFDSLLCDHLYTRMEGTGKNIKIIAVDEETLDAYGNFHQWSREKAFAIMHDMAEQGKNDEKPVNYMEQCLE